MLSVCCDRPRSHAQTAWILRTSDRARVCLLGTVSRRMDNDWASVPTASLSTSAATSVIPCLILRHQTTCHLFHMIPRMIMPQVMIRKRRQVSGHRSIDWMRPSLLKETTFSRQPHWAHRTTVTMSAYQRRCCSNFSQQVSLKKRVESLTGLRSTLSRCQRGMPAAAAQAQNQLLLLIQSFTVFMPRRR